MCWSMSRTSTWIPASGSSEVTAERARRRLLWFDVLVRLRRSRGPAVGGMMVTVLALAAIAAPLLTPYDPLAMHPADRLRPPGLHHPFGTDVFGRDLFTRVLYGSRISLQTGLVSVLIAVAVGVPIGLTSGYYGGVAERVFVPVVEPVVAVSRRPLGGVLGGLPVGKMVDGLAARGHCSAA